MFRALILLSMVFFGCTEKKEELGKSDEKISIGSNLKAYQYSDIYFAGQPSKEDIQKLKDQGFAHIVNFRSSNEHEEKKEREQVESLGMKYTHAPFNSRGPLTDEYIDRVTTSVVGHRQAGKTLIHCGSGQRVGVWVGGHFFKDHKYDKGKALAKAKEMGLSKEGLISMLNNYLATKISY